LAIQASISCGQERVHVAGVTVAQKRFSSILVYTEYYPLPGMIASVTRLAQTAFRRELARANLTALAKILRGEEVRLLSACGCEPRNPNTEVCLHQSEIYNTLSHEKTILSSDHFSAFQLQAIPKHPELPLPREWRTPR
jgi:hypothetical protein